MQQVLLRHALTALAASALVLTACGGGDNAGKSPDPSSVGLSTDTAAAAGSADASGAEFLEVLTAESTDMSALSISGLRGSVPAGGVSASVTTLSFSEQVIGTVSAAKVLTVKNRGTAALSMKTLSATGAFTASTNCGSTLAIGAICQVSVGFAPTIAGDASGKLSLGGAAVVTLQGAGTQSATLRVTPGSADFGTQAAGTQSEGHLFTLSNTGTTSISGLGVALANSQFTLDSKNCGTSLAPGASCAVMVVYAPSATTPAAPVTAALDVTAKGLSTVAVPLAAQARPVSECATDSGSGLGYKARLLASNGGAGDAFGTSASMSGTSVAVGAPGEASRASGINSDGANLVDNSMNNAGAAYVFTCDEKGWTQQAYVKPSVTATGMYFGQSIALDGDTLVVGAPGQVNGGAAYVFTRTSGKWSQQAILGESGLSGSPSFGSRVAVAGNTIAVGAFGANSVFVYRRSGTTWIREAALAGSSNYFGARLALTDGTLAVVSSDAVTLFQRAGSVWKSTATLPGGTLKMWGIPKKIGFAATTVVALSSDHLVATTWTTPNGNLANVGAACAFVRSSDGTWQADGDCFVPNVLAEQMSFGQSGAVILPSNRIVVAADADSSIGKTAVGGKGSAIVFARSNGQWIEEKKLVEPDPSGESYLFSYGGLSSSGKRFVVSEQLKTVATVKATADGKTESVRNTTQGVVYVYGGTGTDVPAKNELPAWKAPTTSAPPVATAPITPTEPTTPSTVVTPTSPNIPISLVAKLASSVASLPFAPQLVGSSSANANVVLSNTGTARLTLKSVSISGPFALSNGCGTTVAAGATCQLGVTFRPAASGAATGTLTVSSDASTGATLAVALSGSAYTAGAATVTPASADFGLQAVGSTDERVVTITNTGGSALTGINLSSASSQVTVNASGCPASLAAGSSCNVLIGFAPTAPATLASAVRLTATGAASLSIPVSGSAAVSDCAADSAPALAPKARLLASNANAVDHFGAAVGISGNTVAVGADQEASARTGVGADQSDNSMANAGAVYVFTCGASGWVQQAYVKPSRTEKSAFFGSAVGIDGDTMVVGAKGESSGRGTAYVFVRVGGKWAQQAILSETALAAWSLYGASVAISGDTIAVGASNRVHVYRRSGTTWKPETVLKGDLASFGKRIALLGDSLVVAGGSRVLAYQRTGSVWSAGAALSSQRITVIGVAQAISNFGDGATLAIAPGQLVVGNPQQDSNAGVACAFAFVNGAWQRDGYCVTPKLPEADSFFGSGAAIVSSGRIVIAAEADSTLRGSGTVPGTKLPLVGHGAAYVFRKVNGQWTQEKQLLDPEGLSRYGQFGLGGSGGSGKRFVVGEQLKAVSTVVNGTPVVVDGQGAVYVY